jgi:hypothetical protein
MRIHSDADAHSGGFSDESFHGVVGQRAATAPEPQGADLFRPETGYLKSTVKSVWGVGKQDWPINIEVGLDVVRQCVVYGSVIRRSRFCVLKYDPPLAGLSHEGLPNLEGSEIPEADGTKRKQRNHQAVAHHNCSLEPTSFRVSLGFADQRQASLDQPFGGHNPSEILLWPLKQREIFSDLREPSQVEMRSDALRCTPHLVDVFDKVTELTRALSSAIRGAIASGATCVPASALGSSRPVRSRKSRNRPYRLARSACVTDAS